MKSATMGSRLWEFISVSALSLVLGTGIGFLQGGLSVGSQIGEITMVLPEEGALTGAILSFPIGWIAYYGILQRKVTFELFRTIIGAIVLIAIVVGLTVGYLTAGDAAFLSSILMIPIILVTIGIIRARFADAREPIVGSGPDGID